MSSLCSVQGCRSNSQYGNEAVIAFPLPETEPLRNSWLSKIPIDLTEKKNPVICIEHFDKSQIIEIEEEDVKLNRKVLKLKEGSVPSVFHNLLSVQKTEESLFHKEHGHLDKQTDHEECIEKNVDDFPSNEVNLKNDKQNSEDKVILVQAMDSQNGDKVSRVINTTHDRFNIDGIIAEMIVEVDHPINSAVALESPDKNENTATCITKVEQIENNINIDDSSKVNFAKTLGLMRPKVEDEEPDSEIIFLESVPLHVKTEATSDDTHLQTETAVKESTPVPKKKRGRKKKSEICRELQRILPPRNEKIKSIPKGPLFISGPGVQLKKIASLCDRLEEFKCHGLKTLYRILYLGYPKDDITYMKKRILEFSGFTDDKYEYNRRKQIVKVLAPKALRRISSLFGIKFGSKLTTIDNIMKFLQKPTLKLDPTMNAALQPTVMLIKLDLDTYKRSPSGESYIIPKDYSSKGQERQRKSVSKSEREKNSSSSKKEKVSINKPGTSSASKAVKISSFAKIEKSKSAVETEKTPAKTEKTPTSTKMEKPTSVTKADKTLTSTKVVKSTSITKTEKKVSATKTGKTASASKPLVKPEKVDRKRKLFLNDEAALTEEVARIKKVSVHSAKESKGNFRSRLAKKFNLSSLTKTPHKMELENRRKGASAILERKAPLKRSLSKEKKEKPAHDDDDNTKSASKRCKFENMSRRSADKRKKPNHYGEWLQDDESISDLGSDDELLSDYHSEADEVKAGKVASKIADASSLENEEEESEEESSSLSSDSSDEDVKKLRKIALLKAKEKKTKVAHKARNLGSFPPIKKCIESASSNVLQRLHVILYGTYDEHDEMVKKLLNFDGFKFLEGSDEWTHKKFLISLVSMTYLKEYVEVLCLAGCSEPNVTPKCITERLMTFLMAPQANLILGADCNNDDDDVVEIKTVTKGISKVTHRPPMKKVLSKAERGKVDDIVPKKSRAKKVLMNDDEVKKLELEIAREERAKRRADLVKPGPSTAVSCGTDSGHSHARSMLNVIKNNRVLKTAGLDPITPTSSDRIARLGDTIHVKFMVVTLNYLDLEILHNLIFLHDAVKSRIRRNILNFEGFKFDESSSKYKFRETVLNRLGESTVKRIAFIFGLTPLNTNLPLKDLIDLIMHFLMCPSKIKQIPIKEFPSNFFQEVPRQFLKEKVLEGLPPDAYIDKPQRCNSKLASIDDIGSDSDESDEGSDSSTDSADEGIPIAELVVSNHAMISKKEKPKPNASSSHSLLKKNIQMPKQVTTQETQDKSHLVIPMKKSRELYSSASTNITKQSKVMPSRIGKKITIKPTRILGKFIVTNKNPALKLNKLNEKPMLSPNKKNEKIIPTSNMINEKITVAPNKVNEKITVPASKINEKITVTQNKSEPPAVTQNKCESPSVTPDKSALPAVTPDKSALPAVTPDKSELSVVTPNKSELCTVTPNKSELPILIPYKNNEQPPVTLKQINPISLLPVAISGTNQILPQQFGAPVISIPSSSGPTNFPSNPPILFIRQTTPNVSINPIPSCSVGQSITQPLQFPSFLVRNSSDKLQIGAPNQLVLYKLSSNPVLIPVTQDKNKVSPLKLQGLPAPSPTSSDPLKLISTAPVCTSPAPNNATKTTTLTAITQTMTSSISPMPALRKIMIINKPVNANPALQTVNLNPLVQTVNANPVMQTVIANPDMQTVNANPAVQTVNVNPVVQTINPDPAVRTITLNPATRTITLNPAVQTITLNSMVQTINSSSAVQMINSGSAVQTINSSSAVQTINSSSAVQTINSSSAVQTINSSSAVQTINSSSAVQTVNSNSKIQTVAFRQAVQAVTLNPAVQKAVKESITPNTSVSSPSHSVTVKSPTPLTISKLPPSVTPRLGARAFKSMPSARKSSNPGATVSNIRKYGVEDYMLKQPPIPKQPVEIIISSDESSSEEENKEDNDGEPSQIHQPVRPISNASKGQSCDDQQLFNAIRDIIHCSDIDDITLRIISQKLTDLFPQLNLRQKQDLIKSSIKKVIAGMTSSTDSS